ncbi:MAG TPA: hypothetical protein VN999_01945 [Thermoanaerobaculia bacterium]|nr:hypothetical protein [Thermoanaerobaculia bacterium]
MKRLIFTVLAVACLLPAASFATCNDKCGPDNNLQYDDTGFQTFEVPRGMVGRVAYSHSAQCEQAIVFYDVAYNRIGRLGDLENDQAGLTIAKSGLRSGTYHVGGFMKYNFWRTNKSRQDKANPKLAFGWDDAGCKGAPADGDYNDSTLIIRLEKLPAPSPSPAS